MAVPLSTLGLLATPPAGASVHLLHSSFLAVAQEARKRTLKKRRERLIMLGGIMEISGRISGPSRLCPGSMEAPHGIVNPFTCVFASAPQSNGLTPVTSHSSPSFLAILIFISGGLFAGRSFFPNLNEESEIAKRVEQLESTMASRANSGRGQVILGKQMERWATLQAEWKFMDSVKQEPTTATASVTPQEGNLVLLQHALKKSSDSQRMSALVELAALWGRVDPPSARDWADSLDDPDQRSTARQEVIKSWAGIEPWQASEWLASLPANDPSLTPTIHAFVKACARTNPRLALGFALSVQDKLIRTELTDFSLKYASLALPTDAAEMVRGAGLSPREQQDYLESLSTYRNPQGN